MIPLDEDVSIFHEKIILSLFCEDEVIPLLRGCGYPSLWGWFANTLYVRMEILSFKRMRRLNLGDS